MAIKKLSVCIPCRDRIILTQKCIESIWAYSDFFQKIDIYIYDNNSNLDVNRFSIFENLMKEKKICYYSYDTDTTTLSCFGKSIAFMRWCQMIETDHLLREAVKDPEFFYENFYLLLDNDFVLCPKWWQYMISGMMYTYKDKNIHFLVPCNGGMPSSGMLNKPKYEIDNHFNKGEKITIQYSSSGGSSGFWFMNYEGVVKLKWDIEALKKTYNQSKRQDTETWNMIRRKCHAPICYTAGITPNNGTKIALHLGPHIGGSICNQLQRKLYTEEKRIELANSEETIKNLSIHELVEMYKDKAGKW